MKIIYEVPNGNNKFIKGSNIAICRIMHVRMIPTHMSTFHSTLYVDFIETLYIHSACNYAILLKR